MKYHRHLYKITTLIDACNRVADGEEMFEFQFCPICNKVPTSLVGEEEDAQQDS